MRLLLESSPLPASVTLSVAGAGTAVAVPLPATVSMATGPLTVTVIMTTSRAMTAEMQRCTQYTHQDQYTGPSPPPLQTGCS